MAQFYPHPQMADGHLNKCKECVKCRVKDHRSRNAESIRLYDRERAKSAVRKMHLAKMSRRFREENPRKYTAHTMVNNALRDGRMTKPDSCEDCGRGGAIHGHHDDYAKPLDVRWLCAVCHSQWHQENGEGLNG